MSLDAEQRAIVARAVTGLKYKVDGEQIFRSLPYGYYEIWEPKLDTEFDRPRSQALALVEWISKYIHDEPIGRTAMAARSIELTDCIQNKDTAALEQLAFELLEKTDG